MRSGEMRDIRLVIEQVLFSLGSCVGLVSLLWFSGTDAEAIRNVGIILFNVGMLIRAEIEAGHGA
jgi:hypothetical protein